MTTIFEAIKANDAAKLREILAANLGAIHEQYKSHLNLLPIHFAAECNADMKIFDILFEYKGGLNKKQEGLNRNAMNIAVGACSLEKIKRFLALGGKICKNTYYIWEAARNPDADVIRYFLKHGEPIGGKYGFDDLTPAFVAVNNPNAEILQILIDHGADLGGMSSRGLKIIHFAAQNGSNPEVIKILLDHGFSVDEPDRWGQTPLFYAANEGRNAAMVKILLETGADPLKKNSLGNTPLKLANTKEKMEILRLAEWVAQGKDPTKMPKPKWRPLPKPKGVPKPLKLDRVELANRDKDFEDYPLCDIARFYKECQRDLLHELAPEIDLQDSFDIVYHGLTDHDLVTLIDFLDGTPSRSMLILVLRARKQMVISGGRDDHFLCWINLEEDRDAFANLVNTKTEGHELICIGYSEELGPADFEPRQLSDRKTILKVAQYYAQKGKPDPKFEWDYDT